MLDFRALRPADVMAMSGRPGQQMTYGLPADYDYDDAAELAGQPVAWAAWQDSALIAAFGIYETFPGQMGICWAMLAEAIGPAHTGITRFIRRQIAESALPRLELYARSHDFEGMTALAGVHDPAGQLAIALADPTPQIRWALLLGMQPAHLLRRFGLVDESWMLFERILPRRQSADIRAAA